MHNIMIKFFTCNLKIYRYSHLRILWVLLQQTLGRLIYYRVCYLLVCFGGGTLYVDL